MTRRFELVGRSYIAYQIRMIVARERPDLLESLHDEKIARIATAVMDRKGFPKPVWDEKKRVELCRRERDYPRTLVDVYMKRIAEPHLAAGLLDVSKWSTSWR